MLLPVLPAHQVPWINTEEEIDYMLEVIPQVVEQLRGMSDDWRKKHCED